MGDNVNQLMARQLLAKPLSELSATEIMFIESTIHKDELLEYYEGQTAEDILGAAGIPNGLDPANAPVLKLCSTIYQNQQLAKQHQLPAVAPNVNIHATDRSSSPSDLRSTAPHTKVADDDMGRSDLTAPASNGGSFYRSQGGSIFGNPTSSSSSSNPGLTAPASNGGSFYRLQGGSILGNPGSSSSSSNTGLIAPASVGRSLLRLEEGSIFDTPTSSLASSGPRSTTPSNPRPLFNLGKRDGPDSRRNDSLFNFDNVESSTNSSHGSMFGNNTSLSNPTGRDISRKPGSPSNSGSNSLTSKEGNRSTYQNTSPAGNAGVTGLIKVLSIPQCFADIKTWSTSSKGMSVTQRRYDGKAGDPIDVPANDRKYWDFSLPADMRITNKEGLKECSTGADQRDMLFWYPPQQAGSPRLSDHESIWDGTEQMMFYSNSDNTKSYLPKNVKGSCDYVGENYSVVPKRSLHFNMPFDINSSGVPFDKRLPIGDPCRPRQSIKDYPGPNNTMEYDRRIGVIICHVLKSKKVYKEDIKEKGTKHFVTYLGGEGFKVANITQEQWCNWHHYFVEVKGSVPFKDLPGVLSHPEEKRRRAQADKSKQGVSPRTGLGAVDADNSQTRLAGGSTTRSLNPYAHLPPITPHNRSAIFNALPMRGLKVKDIDDDELQYHAMISAAIQMGESTCRSRLLTKYEVEMHPIVDAIDRVINYSSEHKKLPTELLDKLLSARNSLNLVFSNAVIVNNELRRTSSGIPHAIEILGKSSQNPIGPDDDIPWNIRRLVADTPYNGQLLFGPERSRDDNGVTAAGYHPPKPMRPYKEYRVEHRPSSSRPDTPTHRPSPPRWKYQGPSDRKILLEACGQFNLPRNGDLGLMISALEKYVREHHLENDPYIKRIGNLPIQLDGNEDERTDIHNNSSNAISAIAISSGDEDTPSDEDVSGDGDTPSDEDVSGDGDTPSDEDVSGDENMSGDEDTPNDKDIPEKKVYKL